MIRTDRVDLLLKFSLAAAGREDYESRELGPIHLVKLVYIADLAHASAHRGETFTGAPWRFHHFGPWSAEVFQRIEPAAQAAGAARRVWSSSRFADDAVRWSLVDDEIYEGALAELPSEVSEPIKRCIHEFGSGTSDLLRFVYTTPPMLCAAPGELLSFDCVAEPTAAYRERRAVEPAEPISRSAARRQKQEAQDRRKKVRDMLKQRLTRSHKLTNEGVSPPPRYDALFFEAQDWLDSLAGEPIAVEEGEVVFSDEIWKSRSRSDPEIS